MRVEFTASASQPKRTSGRLYIIYYAHVFRVKEKMQISFRRAKLRSVRHLPWFGFRITALTYTIAIV